MNDPRSTAPGVRAHLAAFAILAAATVAIFAPALPHVADVPFGNCRLHPIESTWLFSLVESCLWSWPPSTTSPLINYPEGWNFLNSPFVDIGHAVLAAPTTRLLGPLASHNLTLLALTFAAGAAAYALAYVVTGRVGPSLVAGLLYCTMDPLLFAIQWGETDVANVWLLPAYLATALWSLRRAPRAGFVAGCALGLAGWFNHYYMAFNWLVTVVALCVACRQLPALWRRRRHWSWYAAFFLVGFALVYVPRASLGMRPANWRGETDTTDHIQSLADLTQVSSTYDASTNLDLSGLLNPLSPNRRNAEKTHFHEGVLYCGFGVLLLAWLGFRRARPAHRGLLLAIGLTALVLSLGTYLKIEGRLVFLGPSRPIPLPYGIAALVVPFLERIHHPFRFIALSMMAASVLAGCGASFLADRLQRSRRRFGLAALVLLCVVERLWASPGLAPISARAVDVPSTFYELSLAPERPGLLHLPMPFDRYDGENEGARLHILAQFEAHHAPLYTDAAVNWTVEEVRPLEMACHLHRLSSEGVGAIVLSTDLDELAPRFTRNHPFGLSDRYKTTIPIIRRNLRQVIPPEPGDDPTEVYYLPPPGELFPDADELEACEPLLARPFSGAPLAAVGASPAGADVGPNSPYPISFPKMFATIIYLEENDSAHTMTPVQAEAIIDRVRALTDAWELVLDAEDGVKGHLSCDQVEYIVNNKQSCETNATPRTAPDGGPPVNPEVATVLELLAQRAQEPDRSPFVACSDDSSRTVESEHGGTMGGSLFDTACSILRMESDRALRVTPHQAPGLLQWYESVIEPLQVVTTGEQELRALLTTEQMDILVGDFDEINEVKHQWGGGSVRPDGVRERDRLGARVVQILQARIDGTEVPQAERPQTPPPRVVEGETALLDQFFDTHGIDDDTANALRTLARQSASAPRVERTGQDSSGTSFDRRRSRLMQRSESSRAREAAEAELIGPSLARELEMQVFRPRGLQTEDPDAERSAMEDRLGRFAADNEIDESGAAALETLAAEYVATRTRIRSGALEGTITPAERSQALLEALDVLEEGATELLGSELAQRFHRSVLSGR